MKKLFFIFSAMIFLIVTSSIAYAEPIYFIHVETGYTLYTNEPTFQCQEVSGNDYGNYCLARFSNKSNIVNLKAIEDCTQPGVEEKTLVETAKYLKDKGIKNALFLFFPFYADEHYTVLKNISDMGFNISIHMHENWKWLASQDKDYIKNYTLGEKQTVEKAIEKATGRKTNITVFSYGPGKDLTNGSIIPDSKELTPEEREKFYLTQDERLKIFKGVADAGYTTIDASFYRNELPSELSNMENLVGLPHSYELNTNNGIYGPGMNHFKNIVNNCTNGKDEVGICNSICDASIECDGKLPTTSWCDSYNTRTWCSSTCKRNRESCTAYGSSYYCSSGACKSPGTRSGAGCPILKAWDGKEFKEIELLNIHAPENQDTIYTSSFSMQSKDGKYEIVLQEKAYLFWDGSHIDSVKLIDNNGKECRLLSAVHSKQGDVLKDISNSDDVRVRTYPHEEIKLVFDECSGNDFTFVIEGYNRKTVCSEGPCFAIGSYVLNIDPLIAVAAIVLIAAEFVVLLMIFRRTKKSSKKKR
jgi:hypothetical protein